MNNSPPTDDDLRDLDHLIAILEETKPTSTFFVSHQVDVYDLSARFDPEFYCPSKPAQGDPVRVNFGRDMTFDFVEIAVMLQRIAELGGKLKAAKTEAWLAFSAGYYPWKPDLNVVCDHIAAARQHIIDAHAYVYELHLPVGQIEALLGQVRHPVDPKILGQIDKISEALQEAATTSVVDLYMGITRLGRSQDRAKAIISGAIYALDNEAFDACRDFIEMICDDEVVMIMRTYLAHIDRAKNVRNVPFDTYSSDLRAMLMIRATPIPRPEDEAT